MPGPMSLKFLFKVSFSEPKLEISFAAGSGLDGLVIIGVDAENNAN